MNESIEVTQQSALPSKSGSQPRPRNPESIVRRIPLEYERLKDVKERIGYS